MKAAVHLGPNYIENLGENRNTHFEELQNLFEIRQNLMFNHQAETLNVSLIDWRVPSWARSTLTHDQVITWTQEDASTQIPSYAWRKCQIIQKPIEDETIIIKNSTIRLLQRIIWNWWRTD